MNRLNLIRILSYPFRSIVGSGLGNKWLVRIAFKWFGSHMIKAQMVVVDVDDYKLRMSIGGDNGLDAVGAGLLFGRGYEITMTDMFKTLVGKGMTVVDAGAHIGYYAILASRLVGESGKVWAFEPQPRNYDTLVSNMKLNRVRNVFAMSKALGGVKRKGYLHTMKQLSGEASLINIPNRSNNIVPVDVVLLDDIVKDKVDIIKIDVDGGETDVLKGAQGIIGSNPDIKVFTEMSKVCLGSVGLTCFGFWNVLKSYGFAYIYLIDERNHMMRLVDYDELMFHLKKADGANLLCSKTQVSIPFPGLVHQSDVAKLPQRVGKRISVFTSILKHGDSVLDIGCGVGTYVEKLLRQLPVTITALDRDVQSIEYARSHNNAENVTYIVANGETYTSDEKYDVIICSQVLEHIRTPMSLLMNARELLKDGGVLCLGVPNGYGCFEIENIPLRVAVKTKMGQRCLDAYRRRRLKDSLSSDSPHVQHFTKNTIKKLLRESGWVVESFLNEEMLGGMFTDRTLLKVGLLGRWNLRIADKLPSSIVNGWLIVCCKNMDWKPTNLTDEVRDYWDSKPCGTGEVSYEEGTKEFYEALSERRNRLEPLIDVVADFDKWNGKKVLEIGCGVGCDLERFARGGADVTGMDLSGRSVELAQRRFELFGLKGKLLQADAQCIPFDNEEYSMVYTYGVIHHMESPQLAMSEIHRVLKDGGEVRAVLYNKNSLVALEMYLLFGLLKFRPFRSVDDILWNHHESKGTKAYTVNQIRDIFKDFKDVHVWPMPSLHDIRCGKGKYLPTWLLKIFPKRFSWLVAVKGIK